MTLFRFEKYLCYSVFFTGFIGSAFFTINLEFFSLYPYRIFLGLLWGIFLLRMLFVEKVEFDNEGVRAYFNFFIIWIIYAFISIIWAESKVDSIRNIIFLFMGISLAFFATYYFKQKKDLIILFWMWIFFIWCLILIGYWEHFSGNHLPSSRLYGGRDIWLWHRPTGFFYNPNDYATFLAISIPFMLGLIRYAKSRLLKFSGIIGIIAAFYLIVITGSRANIIAVCIEVAVLLLFLTNLKQKIKTFFIALIICIVLRAILPLNLLSLLISIELKSFTSHTETRVGSLSIRKNLAINCIDFLYPTAGLGVGAGNVEYWMENYAHHNTKGIVNAHNWWLEILTNYGIIIFVWYILIYKRFLIDAWHCWKKSITRSDLLISETLLLSVVGFIVACISSSSVMAFEPNWMLFSFVIASINQNYYAERNISKNANLRLSLNSN